MRFFQNIFLLITIIALLFVFHFTRQVEQSNNHARQATEITEQPIQIQNVNLREAYLDTVVTGLLGGLTHMAQLNKTAQSLSSYDPKKMGECLTRDWHYPGKRPDFCIVKWDGYERLMQVRHFYERIREEGIEGDLVECGVWRGGMTIMMRALLKAYGDVHRTVWVSDSFSGVPNTEQQKAHPDFKNIPEEIQKMDAKQWGEKDVQRIRGKDRTINKLTVEGQIVEDNFRRYGLLDEQVKFLPGWFNEALPKAHEEGLTKIAFLRIDGDLYSSTMDVLVNLYQYVTPGGYIFFDDYNIPQSKQAVHDFFERNGLDVKLIKNERITEAGHLWRKDLAESMGSYFQKPREELADSAEKPPLNTVEQ